MNGAARGTPARRGLALALAVWRRFQDERGWVLAGYLAYSAMLAILPFLIFATALTGFLIGPESSQQALDFLFASTPDHVARTLEPVVLEVIGQRRGGVLTVSALGSVWAASNGIEALRIGFDHAYHCAGGRTLLLNRLISVAMVLIGFAIFAALTLVVILAPLLYDLMERATGGPLPAEGELLRYGTGFAVLWIILWIVHRILPARAMAGFRLWPGILASVLIWVITVGGMSIYLQLAPSLTLSYGTMAGIVLTLLFFYALGAGLVLGAHVNAVVNGLGPGAAILGGANRGGPGQI